MKVVTSINDPDSEDDEEKTLSDPEDEQNIVEEQLLSKFFEC